MPREKIDYVECDCGSEIIQVTSDNEVERTVCLAIYEYGSHPDRRLPFFTRFRHAIKVLKTGRPYSDQIVLMADKASKLAEILTAHVSNA